MKKPGLLLSIVKAVVALLCIFVLYVVFFPVYTGGHERKKSVCLSNLKQLWIGNVMYSYDNDDCLPLSYTFQKNGIVSYKEAVQPYLKNDEIYLCNFYREGHEENYYRHFESLKSLINAQSVLNLSKVEEPALQAWMRDPVTDADEFHGETVLLTRHEHEVFAVAYLDGKVKKVSPIEITAALRKYRKIPSVGPCHIN